MDPWWQTGVIYQIYPRSFQDSDGDGVGDLRGITARLDYLADLGIDAIWISPVFRSPMADFGYDVSDHTDIDPLFGSLADFDGLLEAAHGRGLKVILDLVPNHTSDRHPWFLESRASRDNPKRDWYIWRDPRPDGGPPTNWQSEFGGSAWTQDAATGQFYYHAFLAAQPDLNWRNPAVREAIYDVMRFWLDRGVDGFRVDVIWHLIKDDQFRDNPANPSYQPGMPPHHAVVPLYTADRPEIHDVVVEMRRVVNAYSQRVLIGEIYLPVERLVAYYGRDLDGLHLPFNFALLGAEWNARLIARLIEEYEAALPSGGWPNWVLGNHDKPRIASRVGPDQARIAAIVLLTLRGTPTIYYGDELGMEQVPIAADQVRDPFERNVPGQGLGRDGCRTPMPWDAGEGAGFSHHPPWLPLEAGHRQRNVDNLSKDRTSILNLYRRLIAARRRTPALSRGKFRPLAATGDLLLYLREADARKVLVALNLGRDPVSVTILTLSLEGTIMVSSFGDRDEEAIDGSVDLRANEGVVVELARTRSSPTG
jgi:alpha-glucosidase